MAVLLAPMAVPMPVETVWILPAALAGLDWWAMGRGDLRTETWAKPATLAALLGDSLDRSRAGVAASWSATWPTRPT